jgi:hypothetical protein
MMRTGRRRVSIRAIRFTAGLAGLGVMAAVSLAACGDDSGDSMCAEINLQCTTAFEPTFSNVYKFVISQQCAAASCHGAAGADGLKMTTEAEAYQALVAGVGGKPRVVKNDAACSILTERIESDDPAKRMPFMGQKLSAEERCAIEKWIEAGAAP